ncbi:MAG: dihydrolipoamide dehydrogenase, partial [Bacteroidota bacterium]|nr:dihydrolipoamide dehydrogenase [Bacteroidota bacterium]
MTDLLIIGGGPAGYVAAERAGHHGVSVTLFEKKALGGVCLNEGCIPTKTLLYSAKTYENALHADKYGVQTENVGYDYEKIVSRKNKVVRKLVAGVKSKMTANQVTVIEGAATIVGRGQDGIEVSCNGNIYKGKNLLICTGSEAAVPPIPGLKEAGDVVVTNREILELKQQPKSLVVIGGGVIGMEFASFFNSLGTKVTIVEMLPEILGGLDFEISAMLRDIYAKKGIDFHLNAKVVQVDGHKVVFEKEGKTQTVEGEKILLSVGRRPVTQGFGLENLNVELNRGGIKTDEKMRTNVPGVFAAGDVTGFSLLAHTASREGEVVVNNLVGRQDRMRYNAIPGVVYTNPEVAGVGETEESAKAKGI